MAASFLGWSLDAFDYFLLVFVLKDIATKFKTGITDGSLAILLALVRQRSQGGIIRSQNGFMRALPA